MDRTALHRNGRGRRLSSAEKKDRSRKERAYSVRDSRTRFAPGWSADAELRWSEKHVQSQKALEGFESEATKGTKEKGRLLPSFFFGAPSGIRTRDPLIKSQLLYQLS